MKKKTIRIVAFFVALISLFSLVACSSEQNGNETKAPTDATVPITTESVASTQLTTLPATTEAQTEPPETEPVVDISGVVFKEETIDGAKYSIPKGWKYAENESGGRFYYADKPIGAYIYILDGYTPRDYPSLSKEYEDAVLDSLRSSWPDYTNLTKETIVENGIRWIVDKSECSKTQIGDWRFTFCSNGLFDMGVIYPKNGDMIPRFLAIYEKVFKSVDLSEFYVETPLTSLMDIETGIVLVDNDYVRITYEGITYDSSSYAFQPVKVNFLIENKSELYIGVQVRECSINGFMCNPLMSTSLPANKKARDGIPFYSTDLSDCDVASPYDMEEMEWSFIIFDSNNYDTLDTVPVTLSIYD